MSKIYKIQMEEEGERISPTSDFWYYEKEYYISPEGISKRKNGNIYYAFVGTESESWDSATWDEYVRITQQAKIEDITKRHKKFQKKKYIIKFQHSIYLKNIVFKKKDMFIKTSSRIQDTLKMSMKQAQTWQQKLKENGNTCYIKGLDCVEMPRVPKKPTEEISRFELMDVDD